MESRSKAHQILEVGQRLLQTRPYSGVSFRDIAEEVDIRSASIHYHFPTKADLAVAVATRYRAAFRNAVSGVEGAHDGARARLRGYAGLFEDTLVRLDRVCLCGMLASEVEQLPQAVRKEVEGFFDDQHTWIAETVRQGQDHRQLAVDVDAASFARTFLAGLEGGMLVARSQQRPGDLAAIAEDLLALL